MLRIEKKLGIKFFRAKKRNIKDATILVKSAIKNNNLEIREAKK